MPEVTKTVTNDNETFAQVLAAVIWEISQAKRLRRFAASNLSRFGIEVSEDATDGTTQPEFTFTQPSDDEYIGSGMTRADLSDAARAKMDAKRLAGARTEAYLWLQEKVREHDRYGYDTGFKLAEVTRQLGRLGFPQPQVKTAIRAYVRQDGETRRVRATVDGEMTEEQARDKLKPHGRHSADHDLTVAAFGEDSHTEELVTEVHVSSSTVWPELPSGE